MRRRARVAAMLVAGGLAVAAVSGAAITQDVAAQDVGGLDVAGLSIAEWGVDVALTDVRPAARLGEHRQILAATTSDDVALEIHVRDGDEAERLAKPTTSVWLGKVRSVDDEARFFDATERDRDGIAFVSEVGIAGTRRRHAYRVVRRGPHVFVAHAVGDDAHDDDALRRALVAVVVGDETGLTIRVLTSARRLGVAPSDPRLRLVAALEHANERVGETQLAVIAAEALLRDADNELGKETRRELLEAVGLALLRDRSTDDAATWLRRCRDACAGLPDSGVQVQRTTYNLACAHAVGGATDAAFAELERLLDDGAWATYREWAQEDADLESLRDDARWTRFTDSDGR